MAGFGSVEAALLEQKPGCRGSDGYFLTQKPRGRSGQIWRPELRSGPVTQPRL